MLALVLLSPLLAGFSPTLYLQRDEITFLDHLSQALAAVPAYAEAIRLAARGAGPLADPDLRMVAVLGPVLLATAAMLALLRWVERQPAEALHAGQLRLVLGVGLALGVVASCAVPSYTVDFWLSVAWGRMFAVGQNVEGTGAWLVRSYKTRGGEVLWEDTFQPARVGGSYSWTQGLALDGGRLFVVGSGVNAAGNVDLILRAYDAK